MVVRVRLTNLFTIARFSEAPDPLRDRNFYNQLTIPVLGGQEYKKRIIPRPPATVSAVLLEPFSMKTVFSLT